METKVKMITKCITAGFVFMSGYLINTERLYAVDTDYTNEITAFNINYEKSQYADENSIEVARGSYDKGVEVANYAHKFLGKPYVYGATGPNSFDCSGLTQYVYNKFDAGLTRTTYTQVKQGVKIDRNNLKSGDLVFFNTQGSLSHVGIYIGGGKFIHAPRSGKNVMISSLTEGYYKERYETARRIFY